MFRRLVTALLLTLSSHALFAECGLSPRPSRLTFSHIEGKGIGYGQGYTSIEGFLSPTELWGGNWLPFLDVRGHIFNNGRWAANAGVGMRYLGSKRVWGLYSFYDYRETKRHDYNQVSLGFETLGRLWDFRINGYLPVGDKSSDFFRSSSGDCRETIFAKFQCHNALLRAQQEVALKGFNAEVGFHLDWWEHYPAYFAVGPYYLNGAGRASWGGEARGCIRFLTYGLIEGNISYDNIYKRIAQIQFSIDVPLGYRRTIKPREKISCPLALTLSERALQRVDRREIIPVEKRERLFTAIDPITGQPYNFIFVNSLSSSDGTFESPYHQLTTALANSKEGDYLYVFPGTGDPYVSNPVIAGFELLNRQSLWGSSLSYALDTQFGSMIIPPMSDTPPKVTNESAGGTIITMANRNEVAGMRVVGDMDQPTGILLSRNEKIASGTLRNNWIELNLAVNTLMTGISALFDPSNPNSQANYRISNNHITLSNPDSDVTGIEARLLNTGTLNCRISNNHLSSFSTSARIEGIDVTTAVSSGTLKANILGNSIQDFTSTSNFAFGITTSTLGAAYISISDNFIHNLSGITTRGIETDVLDDFAETTISRNRISGVANGISINTQIPASSTAYCLNNRASVTLNSIFLANLGSLNLFVIGNHVTSANLGENMQLNNNPPGNLCLVLKNNTSPPDIELSNGGGGAVFILDTSSGNNTPVPRETGTITHATCAP